MDCPWFKGKKIKQCGAVSSTVVLSGFEINTFCRNQNFLACPVFKIKQRLHGKKVSLEEYCLMSAHAARTGHIISASWSGLGQANPGGGRA